MRRLFRDITVAVAGAAVIGLIVTYTTNLSRAQLALVYVGALLACALTLYTLEVIPRAVQRRMEAFSDALVTRTTERVLTGLPERVPALRASAEAQGFGGVIPPYPDELTLLLQVLETGRQVQGSLRGGPSAGTELTAEDAAEYGKWEGKAQTALVHQRDRLRQFRNAPGYGFGLSYREAYDRMDHQLAVIGDAIRELDPHR